MSKNELGSLTSPYLLQHADNPVHWKPWGDDAFKEAKAQDKPILLSIGYAACHWCHVMAHESFEDQESADLMNALYINVKVDREEHPDVDGIYQKALAIMGQQGGWPLTMFITPDGEPFWGGTYFPKTAAYGRSSFKDVLNSISNIYQNQKDNVTNNIEAISEALKDESKPKGDGQLNCDLLKKTSKLLHGNIDPEFGGLKGAPKFPQPIFFDFLWRVAWINTDAALQKLIAFSLDKMCLGGIYDHVGGGFARYSTDEEWLAPHFEKMLYDNALLVSLLSQVWRKFPSPLYKRAITETIDWSLREMKVPYKNGFAYAAAIDADSEGVEGKFCVWSEAEIDALLKEEAPAFKKAYDVTASGNWEGHNILRRITPFEDVESEKQLTENLSFLYEVRQKRIQPSRDGKVLTDWNAMMIKALCEAGLVFDRADWIKDAKEIYATLMDMMHHDGALHHSWCADKLGVKAYLEDYANLCEAALALYEVTGDHGYIDQTQKWVSYLNENFWDKELGGYNFAESQTVAGLNIHPKPVHDNATPSGNGLMAKTLSVLYHLTGQDDYKTRFELMIKTFGSKNPNEILGMAGLCSALIQFENMETIAIVGNPEDQATKSLISKASRYPSPHRKILLGDDLTVFKDNHPLAGKTMIDEKPTAYVCQVGTCSAPLTDSDLLEENLSQLSL